MILRARLFCSAEPKKCAQNRENGDLIRNRTETILSKSRYSPIIRTYRRFSTKISIRFGDVKPIFYGPVFRNLYKTDTDQARRQQCRRRISGRQMKGARNTADGVQR